jgi:hypothetical protein
MWIISRVLFITSYPYEHPYEHMNKGCFKMMTKPLYNKKKKNFIKGEGFVAKNNTNLSIVQKKKKGF